MLSLQLCNHLSTAVFYSLSTVIFSIISTAIFLSLQHCNQAHLEEISSQWCYDEGSKKFFPSAANQPKRSSKPKDRFQCTFCPKIFTTIDPLYQHANRYHLEDIERQWFYNPGRKMYLPKPPDVGKKQNQVSPFWHL